MPAMSSTWMDDITEWETHEVAQTAASTGLEANARIKTIAIARNNFITTMTLSLEISFNKLLLLISLSGLHIKFRLLKCWRAFKIDHLCALNFDQAFMGVDYYTAVN